MAKYFNSITGRYEEMGEDPSLEPTQISIPAGRGIDPTGGMDAKFSLESLANQDARLRNNFKSTDMSALPDIAGLVDIFNVNPKSVSTDVKQAQPEMNPIVKDYLMKKKLSSAQNGQVRLPGSEDMPAPTVEMAAKTPGILEQFSPEKYKEAVDRSKERQRNIAAAEFAAGIGDALARRDSSASNKYFTDLRERIKDEEVGEFNRNKKTALEDYNTKRSIEQNTITDDQHKREMDPNSMESKMSQDLAIKMGMKPDSVKNMSAARFKEMSPVALKLYEIEQRKLDRALERETKLTEKAAKNTPQARSAKLSGTDKARFDNALMTLKAINEMGSALDSGDNTFSVIGDNDYTAAERRATEAYGRMQSGGAINKEEEKRFANTLPQSTDSKDIQRKKLITQRDEMKSRLRTLGYSEADLRELGYEDMPFNYGASKKAQPKQSVKPKTVIQNGHTYTLNPRTGEYE